MSNSYLPPVLHKFAVGDRVRASGHEGVIIALMPYTFVAPAYDVLISGQKVAMSERSLEKIESQESETV